MDRFPAANISSVMHDAYKSYVYIVNDQGVVERRDVTLGNTVNNEQCFSSGVKEGEVVIIDGMQQGASRRQGESGIFRSKLSYP